MQTDGYITMQTISHSLSRRRWKRIEIVKKNPVVFYNDVLWFIVYGLYIQL